MSWKDAKYGTLINLILLIPVIIGLAGSLPSSYRNIFKSEVQKRLNRNSSEDKLTEQDIKNLPLPVQKYIKISGAIGKEKVNNFRAVFSGKIKLNPNADFLNFNAVQYNFFDQPTRAFYINSKMFGLPFDGLHLYLGPNATMKIKLASLYEVVDAKGPEMNKGETVTMFNDMCVLAPATLISNNIQWEPIDSFTAKARFTNQGNTITATLFFNGRGELINFSSNDRFESADGINYKNYEWTTPVKNYKNFDGRRVVSYGEAIWHKPEGKFIYGKFDLIKIDYNRTHFEK